MKKFGIMLLIVVALLVAVGLSTFGDVNQFETETGLTVEALMFPTEGTAAKSCESVNDMAYTEFAIANTYYNNWIEVAMTNTPYDYLHGVIFMVEINLANRIGGVADRLKYPSLGGSVI